MYLLNFMTNDHQLYELSPDSKNKDVFISSVVAHVVALHISNTVDTFPLTAYMQALNDHKDTYILTCPSDELALVTNVIIANDSGTRKYQCKSGNIYFIGNCGRPDQIGECNKCKNEIGGLNHILNEGNSSIDEDRINQSISIKDKKGYIIEDTFDTYHTVRNLHPASYRILHLFLHIIIGVQAHLPTVIAFMNNQDCNIAQYCKKHIENVWQVLKDIFNCEDETLTLVIHVILLDMSQEPHRNIEKFTLPAQKKTWEEDFSQRYVLPKIKNLIRTTNNFRVALDRNAENLLENNKIMKVTDQLSYKVDRQKAYQFTFQHFIENESECDNTGKTKEFLNAAFNNFANSWNCLIPPIKQYQYISFGSCQTLKFIEKLDTKTSKQDPKYHLQSIYLKNAKEQQIINYDDISEIFLYCQHDLRLGRGQEIYYDLYKIEAELAIELVYEKKLIESNDDQMYSNSFVYHKKLFSRSMTILKEVKNFVHQEPIPVNNRTGLQLKHIVALYELVEEHVADIVVNCVSSKYRAELNESLKQEITNAIDFEQNSLKNSTKIPAEVFITSLKRFIVRYLSNNSEIIQESVPLSLYFVDNDLPGCWPNHLSKDIINDKFPTTLQISHIYNTYQYVKENKYLTDQKNQETTSNQIEQYNNSNKKQKKEVQSKRFRRL
ncbi:e3 ubiquitin-protein ligase [Gigaspora margarita]|uniref:E3 ubiquitin-protein ligase n=1 Tax=Gigaspora margarita TaxID=4874 RepID=A0A8H4AX28_GIGMA|nr:e3 ubiquitin-protein ligase [Gigaspora margarita]